MVDFDWILQTINDVITGIILLGSRLYMEGETVNSSRSNSNALVLINTRNLGGNKSVSEMVNPKAYKLLWGNQFAFIHVPLPTLSTTNLSNPVNFVYETHKIIKRKRNNAAVLLTGALLDKLRQLRGPQVYVFL